VAIFHADDGRILDELSEGCNRYRELVVPGIVIDQDVQRGEQFSDIAEEADGIRHREGLIVRNPQENAVRPDVLHEVHFSNDLSRVGAGHTDKQRDSFIDCVYCRSGDGLELLPQEVVTLAIRAGRGDDIDSILDDPVHAVPQVVNGNGLCRSYIHGVVGGEGRHHAHHSVEIFCGQHFASLL